MINKTFTSLLVLAAFTLQAQTNDAVMTIDNITGTKGSVVDLKVNLDNTFTAYSFQFEVTLPEGIVPVLDEYDEPVADWLGRNAADHIFTGSYNATTRQLKIQGYSPKGRSLKGNTGGLFSCPITLNAAPGEYQITTSPECEVSDNDAVAHLCPEMTSTITILPDELKYEYDCVHIGESFVGFENQDEYVSLSLDFTYPSDIRLSYVRLVGENADTHTLTTSQNANGSTHVTVTSLNDDVFSGSEVFEIMFSTPADYTGTLELRNGVATDASGNEKQIADADFDIVSEAEVGIEGIVSDEDTIYYDLGGRKVTNPRNGLYIRNGEKIIKK